MHKGPRVKFSPDAPSPGRHPELSVVVPCFNESNLIEGVLRQWIEMLVGEQIDFEMVVVNDGSSDGTGRILDNLRGEFAQVRVIHQLNFGHGRAVPSLEPSFTTTISKPY